MFNPIEMRRRMVQERIEKSFDNEIEKAHKDGDMHPNGKWVWVSSAAGGKGDWRTINGRAHQKYNAAQGSASGGNTPEDKEYAEKFKKNFKDASDDVLNKVISGKIQGTDKDKRLAKEILDERKSSAEGEKSAKKIIDLLKVSSSKYSDIKKVTAFKTDKGNWAIDYDGANTGIILNGSKLSEKGLKAAGVKIEGGSSNGNEMKSKADQKQDKVARDAGFKNYEEMSGYQEYVTAKNLLKKPSMKLKSKEADRKELEKQVADYEKDHADVIKRIEVKNGKKKADKKSDDWNDNLSGYKTSPFEGAVKVADLKVGDKLVGKNGRTMTVIGVNKTKDGTDVGVKFDNPRIGDGTHWSVFNNNSYYGAKKSVDSYASMDIKDAKKALVGKVVTLVDYWPDGRGGSQDAIGEIKNVRLYGKNKTPIAEVVYPNGDEQMIRLDEIDDGEIKDSYKTSVTISDDKKKLDAIKNKIASSE